MAKSPIYDIPLTFPLGGLSKASAYSRQPPGTSPDLRDVRGFGSEEDRARGGQRPGLAKTYPEQLGSGNPVRFMGQVTRVETTGSGTDVYVDEDDFEGVGGPTLGPGWSAASWDADGSLLWEPGYATNDQANEARGNVRDALSYITTAAYTIWIQILNYSILAGPLYYRIYARMDNSSPLVTTEGVLLEFILTYDAGNDEWDYTGTLKDYDGGSLQQSYALSAGTCVGETGWLSLNISTNTCVVKYNNTQILSQAVTAHTDKRIGIGAGSTFGQVQIYQYRLIGSTDAIGGNIGIRTHLVASSNGVLSAETSPGNMATVSGNQANLSSTHLITGFERGQKMYVADYGGANVAYTNGVVNANGVDIDSASVADWTAHSIDVNNDVLVVSSGTGDVNDGVYKISAVIADKLTTTATMGGAGNCAFRVEKSPKVYDPATNAMDYWWASTGDVPVGCPVGCLYRDRAVLAGQQTAPHVWYMSRQGDLLDWDYSQTDVQRAIAGTDSDAGTIGDVITAAIPWSDELLIFGGKGSIWICRGDPAFGGFIDALSYETGMLDKKAWCFGPDGEIFFMDTKGLYILPRGADALPELLSKDRIPVDIRGIDVGLYDVQLAWSQTVPGVHIFITPIASGVAYHYFWDQRLNSFWRDKHAAIHGPTAAWPYKSANAGTAHLIVGGRDGYLRHYSAAAKTDDGVAIESYVLYEPMFLGGGPDREGIWLDLEMATGLDTDELSYEVLVGDTVEDAVVASAFKSGTWTTAGAQTRVQPRARGVAGILKLSNTSQGKTWMVETGVVRAKLSGRFRNP